MRVRVVGAFASGLALVVATSCRTPTEIVVDVYGRNLAPADLHGVAFFIGVDPDQVEMNAANGYVTASTGASPDATGFIGSLGVVPSGTTASAAILVVGAYGANADPAQCRPPLYTHCIVARRRLQYLEHQIFHVPIDLAPDCLDVPCDSASTCNRGQCYSSETEPNGDMPGGPPPPLTPPSAQDAGKDGNTDGSTDAPAPDGGDGGGPTTHFGIRCNAMVCDPKTSLCCHDAFDVGSDHCAVGGGSSPCGPSASVDIVECDSRDDCGPAELCCQATNSSALACQATCSGVTVCTSIEDCPSTSTKCVANAIYGAYGQCE